MRSWCKSLIYIYGMKVVKKGRVKGTGKPGVYIAPHSSFWDIIILGSELNGFFVSKAEVLKWPVIGLGAKFVRTVFIDREKGVSAIKAMQRSAEKIFATGNSLIVFPEGTRSYEHMKPLKSGPFHIAMQTKCAVKPVIIKYEPRDLIVPKKKGNFIKELFVQSLKSGRVKVTLDFLPELDPNDYKSIQDIKSSVHELMDVAFITS